MTAPRSLLLLVAVFALSNTAFLFDALASPLYSVAATALLAVALWRLFGARLAPTPEPAPSGRGERAWVAAAFLVAFLLALLGGAGRVFHATDDWQVRDAVLADMARGVWPVRYAWRGGDWILRCPVGFYELPGLVGRALGLRAAHLAVLAQDTLVFGAALRLTTRAFAPGWRRALAMAVFVLFSGMDAIGAAIWGPYTLDGSAPLYAFHLERWASGMEYSSFVTDLFWAPNHGLPAFAFIGGWFAWREGRIGAPALAALAALGFLWSPLAIMGTAPFVLFALATEWRAQTLRWEALAFAVAAGVALLPGVAFSHLASGGVEHGFTAGDPGFWRTHAIFYVIEVLPPLYLMGRSGYGATRAGWGEKTLVAAVLLAIPFYTMGVSNDFMMRASIPALGLLAVILAERTVACLDTRRWRPLAVLGVFLAVGALTPLDEIAGAVARPPRPVVTASVPPALQRSVFHRAPLDTYLAPTAALASWSWLLKVPPRTPAPAPVG